LQNYCVVLVHWCSLVGWCDIKKKQNFNLFCVSRISDLKVLFRSQLQYFQATH